MSEGLDLRITGVENGDEIAGARRLAIQTTRGTIPMILHAAPEAQRAALCLSGAIGGYDGPAFLYPRLGLEMPRQGVSIARINYRAPNEFGDCVLDAMAGLAVLGRLGHTRMATVGHSFGGAVAINAGTISPAVTAVVALSSQLAGAHVAGELAPRPLLLIHGDADTILPHQSSEAIFERAGEPKTIKIIRGAGHRLSEAADEIFDLTADWLLHRT
jgi:alpha-beta hydrolase superfamily lysophospholipase